MAGVFTRVQPVEEAVMVPAVGAKVAPALTVKAPAKEKLALVCVVGVFATVKPVKYKVPELEMAHAVPEVVMVALVEKSALALMVSVPANVMAADVVTFAAAPLPIVKLLKVG